nr:hypothetical protein B0A51_03058 [Rachicladosporium sp. CCFEE 5018]
MPRDEGRAMKDEVKAFRKPQQPKSKPNKKLATKVRTVPNVVKEPDIPTVPLALKQRLLDLFQQALYTGPDSLACVQEVKSHLYKRDFAAAFGREDYLRAYALRWSAGRTLAYLDLLCGEVGDVLSESLRQSACKGDDESEDTRAAAPKVLCLGAGAGAEIAAFAGWLDRDESKQAMTKLALEVVDVAAWDGVVGALTKGVTSPPELGEHASDIARKGSQALIEPENFEVDFTRAHLLEWNEVIVKGKLPGVRLVTIMFTLNELYTTSLPKTQSLLSHLTAGSEPGTMLLVVDSPGSYSTVSINGAEKKYPMQWLLDYTLLGSRKSDTPAKWEKISSEDSKWFRLPEGLVHPVELENMRYQMHLYRRLSDASG